MITPIKGKGAVKNELPVPFSIFRKNFLAKEYCRAGSSDKKFLQGRKTFDSGTRACHLQASGRWHAFFITGKCKALFYNKNCANGKSCRAG